MRPYLAMLALGLSIFFVNAADAEKGKVYTPDEAKDKVITDQDVIRFEFSSPGSNGYTTTVKVTEGPATVVKRSKKGAGIGGDTLEFDIKPKANKSGKIKVVVTETPPGRGRKPDVKEFEFEVK